MEAAARAANANAKFRPVMIDTDVVTRFCVTTRPPSTEPVRTLPDVGHAQPVVFLPGPQQPVPLRAEGRAQVESHSNQPPALYPHA
jgi:hypothetical protein